MSKKYQWQNRTLRLWHNILDGLTLLGLLIGVVAVFIQGRNFVLMVVTLTAVFIFQLINGKLKKADKKSKGTK